MVSSFGRFSSTTVKFMPSITHKNVLAQMINMFFQIDLKTKMMYVFLDQQRDVVAVFLA
jgi:hypothetical protein